MVDAPLAPRPAFAGLLAAVPRPGGGAAGVTARPIDDLALASVIARRGREADVPVLGVRTFGLRLPDGPSRAVAGDLSAGGTGPGAWLVARAGGGDLAAELRAAFGDAAGIADQSDGYAVLRLDGPDVRALLAKGVPIDLHVRAFAPDAVAVTTCSHVGVVLWLAGEDGFDVALPRSYAGSFAHWLIESAGEFGLALAE